MNILEYFKKIDYEKKEAGLYNQKGKLKTSWKTLLIEQMVSAKWRILYAGYNNYKMEGVLVVPAIKYDILEFRTFYGCNGLTEIYLQDGIKEIWNEVFKDCKKLKKIHIPYSVTRIGKQAFSGCDSLEEMSFKEGLKYIDTQAFDGCSSLHTITIPESIVAIGPCAFCQCKNLKNIVYKGKTYTDTAELVTDLQHDNVLINHSAFVCHDGKD